MTNSAAQTNSAPIAPSKKVPNSNRDAAHRNQVLIVGELVAPPQSRLLPTGEEVLSFRLMVRAQPPPARSAKAVAVTRERGDSIDVAATRSECRQRIIRSGVGDVVEIEGCLRHRYWRGAGGLAGRYEVEALRIRSVAKLRRPSEVSGPAPAGTAG